MTQRDLTAAQTASLFFSWGVVILSNFKMALI
jgi:hypothetical protein